LTRLTRLLSAAALAGGLTLSLAASASAQQGPPPPPPPGAGQGHHFDPAKMREHMQERRQHRQQILHDALGIRADQEGAWQAFTASSQRPEGERGGPGGMRHRDGGGQPEELTTPQRLDRMAQRMADREQRFTRRAAAIKAFYVALDPRQQKTFDALVMSRMGHGGMGGGFGHRGGHMGGWGRGGPGGPQDGPPPQVGERG
jgi:hypothetical protein